MEIHCRSASLPNRWHLKIKLKGIQEMHAIPINVYNLLDILIKIDAECGDHHSRIIRDNGK